MTDVRIVDTRFVQIFVFSSNRESVSLCSIKYVKTRFFHIGNILVCVMVANNLNY